MAPQRRTSDHKPWWHAHAGWIVALGLAGLSFYQSRSDQIVRGWALQEAMERRLSALEARCK